MSGVHDRFVKTATKLIKKHGRKVKLITKSNTGKPHDPSNQETTEDIIVVNVEFTKQEKAGGLVQSQDKVFLVDSKIKILNTMSILDGVEKYSIVACPPMKPGEAVILYRVHARK